MTFDSPADPLLPCQSTD